ncbi:MAG: tetratricopeptide repeat protein [Bacteroidales bacterium]|nr:tetratricopeptide repeat protein [Bacteroidales bacterium]
MVQKKYNKAIDDFRSSLEFNPESSYAYCSLGFAFLHLDNYKEAMENLNKAIEIYPGYADAYKNRGEVYICMENYEEACNDLKQALSLGLTKSDEEDVKTLVKEYCGEE